jgi:outer membrane receptor for ferrienterochelin and colicin
MALLDTPASGASKREQKPIDSPQAVEVVTGDDLRAMGITRLQDALKTLTRFDCLEAVIGMRGIMQGGQPRTVQMLLDGVPMTAASTGPAATLLRDCEFGMNLNWAF